MSIGFRKDSILLYLTLGRFTRVGHNLAFYREHSMYDILSFSLPQLCFGNCIAVLSVPHLPFHYIICSISSPFQRFKYFSSIHLNGGYTIAAQEKPT